MDDIILESGLKQWQKVVVIPANTLSIAYVPRDSAPTFDAFGVLGGLSRGVENGELFIPLWPVLRLKLKH